MQRARLAYILIPLAAFLAIIPLLANGCSCGHDFDFHILSWMEAARQFTHGNLHPHWAYTPAWNAGEPRFIFYPPISWTIGAILGLIFPWTWTPILYTWLALTAAGLSFHFLARDFTTPTAATLAAILYTVNPYMLFTAYERTAYGELLAAAWIPLLLYAILQEKITIPRIAIPVALLWLTNAPAAVMSCYALALLTVIRLSTNRGGPSFAVLSQRVGYSRHARTAPARSILTNTSTQTPLQLTLKTIAGTALGLGLAAFYILPAAYERRYVQIAMAIIPFYRIQDNFLFHHTADIDHDKVLHTASLVAVILIAATVIALTTLSLTPKTLVPQKNRVPHSSQFHRDGWGPMQSTGLRLLLPITILTIAITFLLTPLTTFIWNHIPELAFLQFPWRLVAILAAVSALTIALALTPLNLKSISITAIGLVAAAALTYPAYGVFHQTCDPEDTVEARLALFHSNQGTDPTDEYTPVTADNDSFTHANPPYWLSQDSNAKAPTNTQPGPAPTRFSVGATQPGFLILNLRDYPSWDITSTDSNSIALNHPEHIHRNDGLIALPIPAGSSTIDIAYAHPTDQTIGNVITAIALTTLAILLTRRRNGLV